MGENELVHAVQEIYGLFGRGDIPTMLGRLTEDVEWRIRAATAVPYRERCRGREAVGGWFLKLAATTEIRSFEPRTFLASGDAVVVLGGEAARARTTGREYAVDWVHVFRFRGTLVSSFDEFVDGDVLERAFAPDA